jgi:hypothetical protein
MSLLLLALVSFVVERSKLQGSPSMSLIKARASSRCWQAQSGEHNRRCEREPFPSKECTSLRTYQMMSAQRGLKLKPWDKPLQLSLHLRVQCACCFDARCGVTVSAGRQSSPSAHTVADGRVHRLHEAIASTTATDPMLAFKNFRDQGRADEGALDEAVASLV